MKLLQLYIWQCGDSCECTAIEMKVVDETLPPNKCVTQFWQSSWVNGYGAEWERLVERMKKLAAEYAMMAVDGGGGTFFERQLEPGDTIALPPKEAAYP